METKLLLLGNVCECWFNMLIPHQAIREARARTDKGHIFQAPFVCYKVTHWKGGTLYTPSPGLSQLTMS